MIYLGVDLLPEHLELTHLQQISEVEQSFHLEDGQVSRKDRIEEFNSQVEPKIFSLRAQLRPCKVETISSGTVPASATVMMRPMAMPMALTRLKMVR